jgi:CDP-diacylglycerol--serine O-phosphatidyltransferase
LWTFDKNPLLPDYTESFTVFSTLEQIVLHPSVNLSWVLISLLIPVFSMFRLAKFNIDTRQSDSFIGLPTPANTIFFMTFPLVLSSEINKTGWAHDLIIQLMNPWIMIPMILIMCYLLIAELPLFALKFKSFGWKGNEIRFTFLITCGILIFTLGWWSLAIIILLYLILSIINNILRKNTSV